MTSMSGHARGRASSRVMVEDHDCVGYPIAVHIGAASVDVGSVVNPFIAGAYSLHFGRGHPLNATGALTPASELYLSPYATTAPSSGAVQRRAELLGALEALLAIKDLYGEQGVRAACAHVHTDSKYVAKVWGEWLDDWEKHGWPGETEEEEPEPPARLGPPIRDSGVALSTGGSPDSRSSPLQQQVSSSSASIRARSYSSLKRASVAGSTAGSLRNAPSILSLTSDASITLGAPHLFTARGRPFDEDLMRDLADLRKHFGEVERAGRGGCYFYAATKAESPAHTTAREFARASGQEEFKNSYRGSKRSVRRKKIPGDGASMMSVDSRASKASRATNATRRGARVSNPPDMPPMPASPVPSTKGAQREAKSSKSSVNRSSSNESFASARAGDSVGDAASVRSATGSMRDAKGRNGSARASRYQSTTSPVPESPASTTVGLPTPISQPAASARSNSNARSSRRVNGAPPSNSSRVVSPTKEEPEDEESRVRAEKFKQAQQAAARRMTHITASPALSQNTDLWPEEERGRVITDLEKETPKKKKGFFGRLFSSKKAAR